MCKKRAKYSEFLKDMLSTYAIRHLLLLSFFMFS